MRILILGAAGVMAEIIELDLLESNAVDCLILADRDMRLLRQRAAKLRFIKSKTRVELQVIDITAKNFFQQLRKTRADVLINSTWYLLNTRVMDAAIKARVHYVDLGGLYWKTREQLQRKAAAKKAGVTCVLGMGETPGTMNVLVRYAGGLLDRVDRVEMRCGAVAVEKPKETGHWVPPYSIQTLIDEITESPAVFRRGRMVFPPPLQERIVFDMPKPIGKSGGYYTLHSELATIPNYFSSKGITMADFAYAYDQESLDVISALHKVRMTSKTPIYVDGASVSPYHFLGLVDKYLIERPKRELRDVEAIRVEVHGTKKGKKTKITVDMIAHYHNRWQKSAGSVGTGTPASIIAQWIVSGKLNVPGVWAPEDVIDPFPFFKELNKRGRGMVVYEQTNNGHRRRLN